MTFGSPQACWRATWYRVQYGMSGNQDRLLGGRSGR